MNDDAIRKIMEQRLKELEMQKEINPLSQYSTAQLKKELRRRKRNE